MKKRVIFLFLAVAVLFFACSSSGDDEVEAWMVDSWLADDNTPDAGTNVLRIDDDGSFAYFSDYAETIEDDSGTFKIDGNIITYENGTGTGTARYTKVSENEWMWVGIEQDFTQHFYRKSACPAP